MKERLIIALDGPAGAGKSTTAKCLADRLGYIYIDTGAMYRAVTYWAIESGFLNNEELISSNISAVTIDLKSSGDGTIVILNGVNVTDKIRTPEINNSVSKISRIESVREALVVIQQKMGAAGGVVMEGRDIGTAVFPDADLKIYLTASLEQRAERRFLEYSKQGNVFNLNTIIANIKNRDDIDSTRIINPLKKADDAIVVDTSNITLDEQVEIIFDLVQKKIAMIRKDNT